MTATLYVLGVFTLILILGRIKVPLAAAITIGALTIGLLFGQKIDDVLLTALEGAIQPRTIALVTVTVLLLGLSGMMREGGQFEQIVSLARAMLRRPAVTMAALPALIGLLPMPGGALFSAPMVESAAGGREKTSGGVLSSINYWFRHIWEHWWPLYPGVMLAMTITETSWGTFAMHQIPLGIVMIFSGLLLFRKTHPDLHVKAAKADKGTRRKLVKVTSSIWLIPVVWIAFKFAIALPISPYLPQAFQPIMEKYVPLIAGLLSSVIWTRCYKNIPSRTVVKIFTTKAIFMMLALIVSIMIFQYLLGEVNAAGEVARELKNMNVPLVIVVAVLPFIAGMVTGTAIGFVGTSFPIVLGMIPPISESALAMSPYIVLAYAFGHLGQLISPLHLCHIVSNKYFETPFAPVYRQLIPTAVVNAVLIIGYFLLL